MADKVTAGGVANCVVRPNGLTQPSVPVSLAGIGVDISNGVGVNPIVMPNLSIVVKPDLTGPGITTITVSVG